MVEHLVLFKLKESTTDVQKREIAETLKELAEIDGVVEFSSGINHSSEGKSKGFEVGMRIGFRDQESLDAYLPSERHRAVIGKVKQHFDDVIVFDYTW
ncbi:Dabb family protein [Paenibacillus filicis]|uniref:Dabb family protein n=1 Tax=Paenibacillus gyeongsangnamensis TaxID=3388067 RepID=A0ABT4Q2J5_9BACL|nr:Dabb family protein [Paenibacillus filicis]MCZ8511033.1 Dabb family protein [Paenibacillus filicis]